MRKKLKEFFEKHDACQDGYDFAKNQDGYDFAKNLTLEEFLDTCPRGDWMLWLFQRGNTGSLKELTLAKAHCANTVRHLMENEKSKKAVDMAIAFGEGRATRKELAAAASATDVADVADVAAFSAADTVAAAAAAAAAASAAVAYAASGSLAARSKNQKQTADICRKYLPIELWEIDDA